MMSLLAVSEDHYMEPVVYAPGRYTIGKAQVGARYVQVIVRIFVDPRDPADTQSVNKLQDAIKVEQASPGKFEVPNWDVASRDQVRDAVSALGTLREGDTGVMFGTKQEVDPVMHLIGTATGWGGNPRAAAVYRSIYPKENDGRTIYRLTIKNVPVDAFWSISLYNEKGFFEKNEADAYSVNGLTAKPDAGGSVTVQFGGCGHDVPDCLPTMAGWNYTIRMYRPRKEILDGSWTFPDAVAVK